MKKLLICLGFVVLAVSAMLPLACNSVSPVPVLAAKAPTATPTGCAGTVRGNVANSTTLAMASGDVVALPVSITGATTVNKLSLVYSDTGAFTGSDVLETALYSVSGTKATIVSGTSNTLFIGSASTAPATQTFNIGNVSLSKNTQYLIVAQFIQDGANSGNTSFNIYNNVADTVTASYMTNVPTDITVGGSSWNLPAVGANGYTMNITTCP